MSHSTHKLAIDPGPKIVNKSVLTKWDYLFFNIVLSFITIVRC